MFPLYRVRPTPSEDTPEMKLLYAVYHRASLDLRLSDPKLRRRARYFFKVEGLYWRDVLEGKRRVEWLRR